MSAYSTDFAPPTYAATLQRSQIPNTEQTPESPAPKSYLVTGDTCWQILGETHTKPGTVVTDARATIQAVIVITAGNDIALIKSYVKGSTIAVMLADGKTLTMNRSTLESIRYLDAEYNMPKDPSGNRIAVVAISSAFRDFRST